MNQLQIQLQLKPHRPLGWRDPVSPLLTVAVDAADLRKPSARSARLLIVGDALGQADQLPVVTTGLVTGHRLHQVWAVSRPPCRLVGDLPLPQFEACGMAKCIKKKLELHQIYQQYYSIFQVMTSNLGICRILHKDMIKPHESPLKPFCDHLRSITKPFH